MGAYIKENWLFVVVAVYLVSMVLYGHYRGFVRLAVSAVSLVLSLGHLAGWRFFGRCI